MSSSFQRMGTNGTDWALYESIKVGHGSARVLGIRNSLGRLTGPVCTAAPHAPGAAAVRCAAMLRPNSQPVPRALPPLWPNQAPRLPAALSLPRVSRSGIYVSRDVLATTGPCLSQQILTATVRAVKLSL